MKTWPKLSRAKTSFFVAFVDHGSGAQLTQRVIKLMDQDGVKRLISANIFGIYDEVPEPFGSYNRDVCFGGKVEPDNAMVLSDSYIEKYDLDYTVLRLAWLNDRNDLNYQVTKKGENTSACQFRARAWLTWSPGSLPTQATGATKALALLTLQRKAAAGRSIKELFK